jgi:hypothetical protein
MTSLRLVSQLQRMSFAGRAGLLAGSIALAFCLAAPVALYARGWVGLGAAAAAAMLCLVPGLIALGVGELFRGPDSALFNLLAGTMIRMGVPLAACVVIYMVGGPLVDGGLAFYLLAFYPVMLLIETLLLAAQAETHDSPARHVHG